MAQRGSSCRSIVNMAFAVIAVLATFLIQVCDSTGTLEVKVTRWQSNCGDDILDLTPHCDPYFKFCIAKSGQTTCTYGSYECSSSNHYHNTRQLAFQDNICGISNPMIKRGIHRFATNEKVKLTMEVWDADVISDDHLVTWTKEFEIDPRADSTAATFINVYTDSNGHHLWFYHRSYCDAFYYSKNCDVYCKAQDNSAGHYTCEDGTGRKICMSGWRGSTCDQDVDECQSSVCYNGGSCSNQPGSYLCSCLEHYAGKNCNQVISLCHSEPCKNNGTCRGNLTSYNCTCDYRWEGPTCQQQVNHCQSSPCYNGGTCYATLGNYTCGCLVDWTGVNCELEVNACVSNPCQNGATCDKRPGAAYHCNCPVQYEGSNCQTLKDPCNPNPCVNSGTCEKLSYHQYNCTCPIGWVGRNCSDYLDILAGQQANTDQPSRSGVNGLAVGVGVGCAVILVLIILVLAFLVRRRRQKKELEKTLNAPDDLHGIVPVDTRGTRNLAFTNDMYNNARNAQLEKQASRPVPPTPTQLLSNDVFYPVKPMKEEEEGAVGGAPNPYAELDGYLDGNQLKNLHTDKKGVLDTRHAAGEEKAENPYHDFGDITRRSLALKSSVTEENPYHDLDDVAIKANGVSYSPSHDNRHNSFDNPSDLPPPLPHFSTAFSSPYDLPHSDGQNPFSLDRSTGNAAKLPSPYDTPSPNGETRAPPASLNSGSSTDLKSAFLYDWPTSNSAVACSPYPYDSPSSNHASPTDAAALNPNAKHYDVPHSDPAVVKSDPASQQSEDDSSDDTDDDFDFGAAQEDIEKLRREVRENSQLTGASSEA